MSIRTIRPALMFVLLLSGPSVAAAQQGLSTGAVHAISPGDMTCVVSETLVDEGRQMTLSKGCTGARMHIFMDSGITLLADTVDIRATAKLIAQFRIDEGTGASAGSWIPIHIAIPVSWFGRAFNDNLDPTDLVAYVAVNSIARLREGTSGDPAAGGTTVSEVSIQGFTHGGPNACLSVPKGKVSAALIAVKCLVGIFMKDEGASHVDIAAVVQAGRTYNIEVELLGELFTSNARQPIGPGGGSSLPVTHGSILVSPVVLSVILSA